ncbi:hypothetical protein BJY01DRAFT_256951 [Aspergillus pseudoustus]|uniref:Uncharacterized protein n=1 Tax=Aspergillus pseudoustus TaxID=1810923 RepID=A0ABR4JQ62_9EURO
MESDSAAMRANCEGDATPRCAGCINAPEYQRCDSDDRKKLLRAATVLKTALVTYRETAYDIDLTRIELGNGVLILRQKPPSIHSRPIRRPFSGHLTGIPEHREAALVNNQCTMAMALLSGLTGILLSVLDIHIGKPTLPTRLMPAPDSSNCPHPVLKAELNDYGEEWIIDTAGAQYGFRVVLVPFPKYIYDPKCRPAGRPTPYEWTETKDLDFFATHPFGRASKEVIEKHELERQSRLHSASFVKNTVKKELLDGSDDLFQQKLEKFIADLRTHMSVLPTV